MNLVLLGIQVFTDKSGNERALLVTALITERLEPASQIIVQEHGDPVLTWFSCAPTRHVRILAHRRVGINTIAHFCVLSFSSVFSR